MYVARMALHLRLPTPSAALAVAPSTSIPHLPLSRTSRSPFLSSRRLHRRRHVRRRRHFHASADPDLVGDCGHSSGFSYELQRLLDLLPPEMRYRVESHPEMTGMIEVVMDLGRRPLARFPSGDVFLSNRPITITDLDHAISKVGDFSADNRAGISRTLHRISAIRNRKGTIIGLTCRVGRAVAGSANLLCDLVKDGGSLLLIGPPGVGKTTIIREIARMLADDCRKRVIIVDTSNEIGGDGDIPHAGVGSARRLQVPNPEMQHKVLIEAVENHMPQVIVIDEIGTKLEALAASTIAQRGIQLVATAHGVTIENLIMNPSLEMLVGGVQSVTLGDDEASRRGVQKTVLERKGPSTFTCAAEIISKSEVRVYRNLESTVDSLLAGRTPAIESRRLDSNGSIVEVPLQGELLSSPINEERFHDDISTMDIRNSPNSARKDNFEDGLSDRSSLQVDRCINLYVYGISEASVLQAIKELKMDGLIKLTENISIANSVIALHSKLKKNSHLLSVIKSQGSPVFVTKTSSVAQIVKAISAYVNEHKDAFKMPDEIEKNMSSETIDALEEARLAIEQTVIPKGESVQLLPRPLHVISFQVDLIESFKLKWEIIGKKENASLRILPFQTESEEKFASHDDSVEGHTDSSRFDGPQDDPVRLPLLPE